SLAAPSGVVGGEQMYRLAMRLVQVVTDSLVIINAYRVLRRGYELVRHSAHRRNDYNDFMTFSSAPHRQLPSLSDALGASDRSAAEFHDNQHKLFTISQVFLESSSSTSLPI